MVTTFRGFPPELPGFLGELAANNQRDWFQAHYADYQRLLVEPAREFVSAMGERLPALGANIHAEPKIRGSILPINRDVRFSADKSPYKNHLDVWFWQGSGPSRECPGYFFRLTPEALMLGAGMHHFTDTALARYREAVMDPDAGGRLEAAVEAIGTDVGYQTLKRVPQGWPADHPRAHWLRYTGLVAVRTQPIPAEVRSPALVDLCFTEFQRLAPLQQWLAKQLST